MRQKKIHFNLTPLTIQFIGLFLCGNFVMEEEHERFI